MNAMKLRPNNDVLYSAKWNEVYTLTNHWKSEMDFYADELRFLKNLTGRYFIWLNKDENIARINLLLTDLKKLSELRGVLSECIHDHLKHIAALIENAFVYDEHTFKDEHAKLEYEMTIFIQKFKLLKKKVFDFTENILGDEKLESTVYR